MNRSRTLDALLSLLLQQITEIAIQLCETTQRRAGDLLLVNGTKTLALLLEIIRSLAQYASVVTNHLSALFVAHFCNGHSSACPSGSDRSCNGTS